jgi:Relaxase/Mobilisation nuclease domain
LAVIIKGTSCAGAKRLAVHLTRTDTNERAEVKEVRGVVAEDLPGALREMESVAAGARTTKPFYHGSINTKEDERLTDGQRTYAIDKLEAALGLTGQPRVVVVHEKEGREHCHIVWSRIDLDRMAAISDSHNYRKHEEVARALEKEFGLQRVQGVHVERDGKERPKRTPSHSEMLQAERTGVSPQQAKELMTGTWNTTKNGKGFQGALAEKGWILARGDRRDFVAIDPNGGTHSIARRIEGATAADVRQRFADIDPRSLMSVAEAKQVQRERHSHHGRHGGRDKEGTGSRRTEARSEPRTEQPRGRGRAVGKAGSAASKIANSLFSALMGETPAPKEKEPEASPDTKDEGTPSQHRQELMRQLSREVSQETEYEVDKGRERSRG